MAVLELRDLKRPAVLGWLLLGYAVACVLLTAGGLATSAFYCIGEACGGWGMPGSVNWHSPFEASADDFLRAYLETSVLTLPFAGGWIALCMFVGARGFQPFLLPVLLFTVLGGISAFRRALWSGEVLPLLIAFAVHAATMIIAVRAFYVTGWQPAAHWAVRMKMRSDA